VESCPTIFSYEEDKGERNTIGQLYKVIHQCGGHWNLPYWKSPEIEGMILAELVECLLRSLTAVVLTSALPVALKSSKGSKIASTPVSASPISSTGVVVEKSVVTRIAWEDILELWEASWEVREIAVEVVVPLAMGWSHKAYDQ